MIDPKTAATLAKIALQSIKDEESRQKTMIIIMAPIISVLLICTFIIYILTNPLETVKLYLSGEEVVSVQELNKTYKFDQFIDHNNPDYLESNGQDFSGISFKDGATEVVYYNQGDARWQNEPYGLTGTVGDSGCGPTSLSIVVSSLTNKNVDPVQMCKWSYDNGYCCEGAGSYHSLIPEGAKHFGLKVEGCTSQEQQRIIDALSTGKLIIAIMAPGHFTTCGHFMVLRGVTKEGKILIADPASRSRSEEQWDMSIILDEARQDAGAGGPFWIISR